MGILWFALFGLVVGAVARALVPGRDPMVWWQTMVLGVVGSYVGAIIGWVLPGGRPFGDLSPAKFVFSVIGAVIALLVYRRMRKA